MKLEINLPVFFIFFRKLMHTKTKEVTDKYIEHNMCTVISCVSTGGINFILYHLSSIHFTSSLFVPNFPFAFTPARLCRPPVHIGMQNHLAA